VCKRLAVSAASLLAAAGLAVPAAGASPGMLVGIYDEPETLYGNPDFTFPILKTLKVQVLRVGLYWGGKFGVAASRPADATDPDDPAYDWTIYDRVVDYAASNGIKVLFSIYGTPAWANGGRGLNRVPTRIGDLRDFAQAAATRYSGSHMGTEGRVLPAVRYWVAWNEPNNPVFLSPQYRRVGNRWVIQSAADYARICTAVYAGVHSTLISSDKVACGVTAPRGNNRPTSSRPSVSPIAFLKAAYRAGMRRFDAYAHHPYYGRPTETPTTRPPAARGAAPTAITLANIDVLIRELSRLYGPRRVWLTEYGYQTRPPDRAFGVTWASQARYLAEAFALARMNPRIDMMLWFLLKDEPVLSGWQSGLITATGLRKPAFTAFRRLQP
jgi:hypothetical protein